MSDRAASPRAFYARFVTARAGASDPRIEQAFAAVPREPFAGPPPWFILSGTAPGGARYAETPDGDPAYLYQDVLIALDRARGINIGEPSLHARCLDALSLREGETVLHVGAGSGYYSAILAALVGPRGRIHAFEIDPALAPRAAANLVPWPWAEVRARSGLAADLPTADVIYVSAGLPGPPRAWLDALNPGGRLLFPLQPEDRFGGMLLVRRPDPASEVWPARFLCRAGFIGCSGIAETDASYRLAAAFAGGGWEQVRSLRLDGRPDGTCWCAGDGWWLSMAEAW